MVRSSLIAGLLSLPLLLHADANREDWVGDFALNYDGHLGSLRIVPSQRKCKAGTGCPGIEVQYFDDHGSTHYGSVDALDQNGQHMTVTLNFQGTLQVFNLYIFSSDKTKVAGTTVWQGRTFGVMATKSAARPAPDRAKSPGYVESEPVLLNDGTIELKSPDGSVRSKRLGICGWTTRYPDGRRTTSSCATVGPVIPPPPPSGSTEDQWLMWQDKNSLAILRSLLGGDGTSSYQNYLRNYENPPNPSVYRRVYSRMQSMFDLVSIR